MNKDTENKLNSDKEFIETVINSDQSENLSVKEILKDYEISNIEIDDLLSKIKEDQKLVLLLDARTEKEYNETSVPFSVNFPILTNKERHEVGFIYKKYSQSAAVKLAVRYAEPKSAELKKFLETNKATDKEILIYCWRGGGRSAYLSKMIIDLGFKPTVLKGGIKSFRKEVNKFFNNPVSLPELTELSGLTGCGKTDLLKMISEQLPVIDLENAARHFSSLLGHIPYEIKNEKKISGQTEFENNIYCQIRLNNSKLCEKGNPELPFLIESESRRVGNFSIPEFLYKKMENAKSIKLTGSIECRVRRIVKDYFSDRDIGIKLMLELFMTKGKFFKQQLSNKIFEELVLLLEKGEIYSFTEIMIRDYYDKRYREKKKVPEVIINTDDMEGAREELVENYLRINSLN